MSRRVWENLRNRVLMPRVSPERLDALLEEARRSLPVPVIWLLGKAQSGKTSIIRALTGATRAEIGNGFQPCTRSAASYDFPSSQERLVSFLDTRGLGETDYDPSEDLERFADQAHLLFVVVKALDHAQASVLSAAREILARRPKWPVIVAQTCLHEAYPPGVQHIQPYPFAEATWPAEVPSELARSLEAQRKSLALPRARYVPIDFTLPGDGFDPEHYGLDQLWEAIEAQLPLGLRAMLGQLPETRRSFRDALDDAARPHIISYAVAAGVAGGVPVPWVDIPLVLAIQGKLFHTIASIYGQQLTPQRVAELGSVVGLGYALRMGGRELTKFIPGVGVAVSAVYAAASTYALGWTACAYFARVREGDLPDPAALRKVYARQFEQGRARLAEYLRHAAPGRSNGA